VSVCLSVAFIIRTRQPTSLLLEHAVSTMLPRTHRLSAMLQQYRLSVLLEHIIKQCKQSPCLNVTVGTVTSGHSLRRHSCTCSLGCYGDISACEKHIWNVSVLQGVHPSSLVVTCDFSGGSTVLCEYVELDISSAPVRRYNTGSLHVTFINPVRYSVLSGWLTQS
jgi:hypothetical protein